MSAEDTIKEMLARLDEVRTTDRIRQPRRVRPPVECHPERPHFSGGLCKSCYEKLYRVRKKIQR